MNTSFDYRCVPSDAMSNYQLRLDEAMAELRKQYSAALGKWLEGCVRKFCPEAAKAFGEGKRSMASVILDSAGYYYDTASDGTVRFMQHDTPLAACKIQINFKVGKPKAQGT